VDGSDYVFTTEAGTPLDPRNVSRWFANVVEAADVGGSLHTFRHTALTGMALAGVPLPVVSRVAGHESISTTMDLYGHLSEPSARDAVAAAAASLGL
jgi:integrase